jgi:hypothetical protein
VVETLGFPPEHLIAHSTSGGKYFKRLSATEAPAEAGGGGEPSGQKSASAFRMLSQEEFEEQENTKVSTGKRYFKFTKLSDIVSMASYRQVNRLAPTRVES